MRPLRSVYAKIFGWFWLTLFVGGLLVVLITAFSGDTPFGRRWIRMTQTLYANSAMDFYTTGGAAGLDRYLDTLERSSHMEGALLDEQLHSVSTAAVPPDVGHVLARSQRTGAASLFLSRSWTAATPVDTPDGRRFFFVLEVLPQRGFVDGTFLRPALSRLLLGMVIAALFCALITRHLVRPIRELQAASLKLADGDLSARVSPAVRARKDELAETARAFDLMAERVETLVERRQEMLADISHELRSPLTRLSVSLELLRAGETDVYDAMEADIARMNTMIGQILMLGRLDLEQAFLPTPVELAPVLHAVVHDADFEAMGSEKRVALLVEAEEICQVSGDVALLRSLFENVIRNAVRYTDEKTTVEVRLAEAQTHYSITIADRGPGVPPESLRKLFEPFFRVEQAREHHQGGTGLGLSLAQRIAGLHGGSIEAENRTEGRGLIVTILLPCARALRAIQ